MNRLKRFLSLFIALTIVFSAISILVVPVSAATVTVAYTGERKLDFNQDWRFRLLSTGSNISNTLDATAPAVDFDDNGSDWSDVVLPHDWSIYEPYGSGSNRAAQGALPGGTGWYRKSFTLPDDFKGKTITIQFDGVQMISEVWVNGQTTNNWKQYLGYVTFEYDITDYLKFNGEKNTIAVKCFSGYQSARWYTGAGIYRNVWLIATDPVYVPANGVYVTTPKDGLVPSYELYAPMTNPTSAKVSIATDVANDNETPQTVSLKSTVYDKAGDVVNVTTENVSVPANGALKVNQSVDVPNPRLWSTDTPNLYWVKTEIKSGSTVVDTVDTRFGIRYLDLNPNGGLFVNGVRTQLNGVCEHSDLGPLGMEVYQAAIDRRILKLKAMGSNAIRTAHNPVSPEYIEACDRLGMLVMEEAFDQWTLQKNNQDYSHYFAKSTHDGTTNVFTTSGSSLTWDNPDLTPNCKRDIKAMVNRDKNAPSVFTWSVGNEIYDTKQSYGVAIVNLLAGYIKEIDTSRPISSCPPTWDGWSDNGPMEQNMAAVDIGGFNYAHSRFDGVHARQPNLSLVGSETVSAFYTRGIYFAETYGQATRTRAENMSSEYPFERNFTTANSSLVAHRDRPYVLGEFVWTGHDYLGEPTPHGGNAMSSVFGIIDTCGFEKDAFYLYKSAWTDIPVCHLLPQNWTKWKLGDAVPVMVYTNGRSVELYLNGVLISTKTYNKATADPMYIEFGPVTYAPGELKAVSKDKDGNVIAEDVVYTAGDAQFVDLVADRAFIENDTRDLVYVEATVRDSAGIMVPDTDNRIAVNVTGGKVIAVGNGNPLDRESQKGTNERKAFSGKALFIIAADKGYTGEIKVTATSEGLTSNTVSVDAVKEIKCDGTGILDYEKPEITVGVGIAPEMPKTVRVVLDNGRLEQLAVSTWDMSKVDLNKTGDYTAYGTAEGATGATECTIHVKEIDAVKDISVTTIVGVYPPLPKFVTIHYKDGEIGAAPVTWDAVPKSQYADINRFAVAGKLGPALTINANITVKKIVSVEEITVYTTVGTAPVMPAGVPVKFNDGSTETLAVDWSIQQNDYASAGVTKVYGKVLGSKIKATAILHVQNLVYLSDLDWVSTKGTVAKDKTVGDNQLAARNWQGGPPFLYTKGIGTLADSELVYDISGRGYNRFQADVSLGFDFGQGAPGSVKFQVYLDGVLSYESAEMTHAVKYETIDLDVSGASELKLIAVTSGEFEAKYNLADWCDAKFLADKIAVSEVILPKQIYLNSLNQVPALPESAQATIVGAGTASFKIEWPQLSASMFSTAGVQQIYGRLVGTENGLVQVKVITDYNTARTAADFSQKAGSWSEVEKFDFPTIGSGAKVYYSALALNPRLIYSATSNMLVENVQNYGFGWGTYPNASGSSNRIVFATPNLTSFELLNVASTTAISSSGNFTIQTSPDGATWTAFTAFTKSGVLSGTGTSSVWPQRTYTSNENAIPAGTNFLRVTYPSGNTWQFNVTKATFAGGSATSVYDTDLAFFKLGDYTGTIDHSAGTVFVTVPKSFDLTNVVPEIALNSGATYSPAGTRNFTNPVTYTVSNGGASKSYTVTVHRGAFATFNLYGGNIGGDTNNLSFFVNEGGFVQAPATDPTRIGYIFKGWTTDRLSAAPMTVNTVAINGDTTFFAIWEKDSWIDIPVSADVVMKTWQGEKTTNYGGDGTMLMRMPGNSASYGLFGENFNTTSTTDSTDMKTALVRFDLDALKDVTVKRTMLSVWYAGTENGTVSSGTNVLLRATRVANDWTERQVTWNTKPGFYVSEGVAESNQFTVGFSNTTVNIDVTSLYNNVPTNENQLSMAICVNNTSADFRLTSKEGAGANPTRAPRLRAEVEIAPDFLITYDLNGGSGEAPIQPVLEAGMSFTAPSASGLTGPTGKLFKAWNTQADGSGTSYKPGDKVTMPAADVVLYAIWADADAMVADYQTFFDTVGVVTVRTVAPEDTMLLLASYDESGVLIKVSRYLLDPNGGQEQDIVTGFNYTGASTVSVYLWDKDMKAMCEYQDIL